MWSAGRGCRKISRRRGRTRATWTHEEECISMSTTGHADTAPNIKGCLQADDTYGFAKVDDLLAVRSINALGVLHNPLATTSCLRAWRAQGSQRWNPVRAQALSLSFTLQLQNRVVIVAVDYVPTDTRIHTPRHGDSQIVGIPRKSGRHTVLCGPAHAAAEVIRECAKALAKKFKTASRPHKGRCP